tara:strand:- start:192 stop:1391 length:1200 start_codon:yes stop_codon:yes gene_type:complete
MHRYIYATKDSWISETTSSQNFGGDEILELRKEFNTKATGSYTVGVTRALVQFDLTQISKSIVDGDIKTDAKYFLRMYSTEQSALPSSYTLVANAVVSQSWEEGTGKFSSNPIVQDGVTWTHFDYKTAESTWSFGDNTASSGSRSIQGGLKGGGAWYTGSGFVASQSFSYESPDINMDVTNIVKKWLSGSTYNSSPADFEDGLLGGLPNYGFIVMYDTASMETTSSTDRGNLKFFSKNTHTIYPPKLEVRWDDHVGPPNYTSSFTALDMTGNVDNHIYMKNLKPEYKETEVVKFRVGSRKKYIDKTVSTTYQTVTGSYIADTSGSYSIIDLSTGETIVPFKDNQDNVYSYLSLDSGSMYFKQDLNTFQPNRFYKILIKIKYNDGQEIIYDDNFEFKVVR